MSKKFISVLLFVVFSIVAANAGVTNIKEVVNNTSATVNVSKVKVRQGKERDYTDNEETTGDIPKNGGAWSGDMWISWVDNQDDFKKSHIRIYVGDHVNSTIFSLWQTRDLVRYDVFVQRSRYGFTDRKRFLFIDNAPKVPGESKVNGERRLIISENDGKYDLTFEKY